MGFICSSLFLLFVAKDIACYEVFGASIACRHGEFLQKDHTGHHCFPCSVCDQSSLMTRECNPTSDTECSKCVDDSTQTLLEDPRCLKCKPCRAGYKMTKKCKGRSKTKCERCPDGTFNERLSYSNICLPCTKCGNRVVLVPCSAKRNTVCGQCKRGYYEDSGRKDCLKCRTCENGTYPYEPQCRGASGGRFCSQRAILFRQRTEFIFVGNVSGTDSGSPTSHLETTPIIDLVPPTQFALSEKSKTQTEDFVWIGIVFSLVLLVFIVIIRCKCASTSKNIASQVPLNDNIDKSSRESSLEEIERPVSCDRATTPKNHEKEKYSFIYRFAQKIILILKTCVTDLAEYTELEQNKTNLPPLKHNQSAVTEQQLLLIKYNQLSRSNSSKSQSTTSSIASLSTFSEVLLERLTTSSLMGKDCASAAAETNNSLALTSNSCISDEDDSGPCTEIRHGDTPGAIQLESEFEIEKYHAKSNKIDDRKNNILVEIHLKPKEPRLREDSAPSSVNRCHGTIRTWEMRRCDSNICVIYEEV